ncbi:acyl-CoA dehydrogenase [Mycobacterium lentiflavum]|uniref:Acyl-CoA dehydrogenase n=1 Tax=Mycobacterium lentiflavum TaxID=141349 RepID=A0A0E4CMA2_MYCLN|nr:acyl-CoA dehydrogenase [Mycobacterium lentiflavum]CQD09057.1 acyl-CoA dehydrogenase [Mycobacterium lentiflavum]
MADDGYQLRRYDYRLDDEQSALRESFRAYFDKTVPPSRVRAAEPTGFDPALWDELRERAIVSMGLPESAGGDGAGLVELALVVEEAGRRAVPAPLPEVLTAARGLARLDPGGELLEQLRDDGAVATVAPGDADRRLVPAGAIATAVIGPRGDDLVLTVGAPARMQPNLASAPMAWWNVTGGTRIGAAADWLSIERDWHILAAAALVGLGQAAVDLGVQYAKDRVAFGVPIGALQAIAHPLVDAANAVEAARRLVWRAAWFCDNEPEGIGTQALCAIVGAGDAAEKAGATAIHTQGGFGVTLESDVQLYYRRAKGLAVLGGERRMLLRRIARQGMDSKAAAAQ